MGFFLEISFVENDAGVVLSPGADVHRSQLYSCKKMNSRDVMGLDALKLFERAFSLQKMDSCLKEVISACLDSSNLPKSND